MSKAFFEAEVEAAVRALRDGKIILYPTDTIWGLGCDATNSNAVQEIYDIKKRDDTKSMIILVADEREIMKYVASLDLAVFHFIQQQQRPTTIIFDGAVGLPESLVAEDGSIAIRIVQDEFCRHVIKRLQKPVVSTSANISGEPSPANFSDISESIRKQVDHIVTWRQDDITPSKPSQIIRWHNEGSYTTIRP